MNNSGPIPPRSDSPELAPSKDSAVGLSVLLAAIPVALSLLAIWIVDSTYEHYRGRDDLDMPEWFAINFDLSMKLLPLGLLGLCSLVASACFFASWCARANLLLRIGFIVQWWVSVAVLGYVMWSRVP